MYAFQLRIDAMQTLLDSTGARANDLAQAELFASTINAILGPEAGHGEHSQIGVQLASLAREALFVRNLCIMVLRMINYADKIYSEPG